MIAALWDDLSTEELPEQNIFVQTNASTVTVRWAGQYLKGVEVNFSITLHDNGLIELKYGTGNDDNGLIGVSSGDGTH